MSGGVIKHIRAHLVCLTCGAKNGHWDKEDFSQSCAERIAAQSICEKGHATMHLEIEDGRKIIPRHLQSTWGKGIDHV